LPCEQAASASNTVPTAIALRTEGLPNIKLAHSLQNLEFSARSVPHDSPVAVTCTATVAHATIVALPVSHVRHIGVPSRTRSYVFGLPLLHAIERGWVNARIPSTPSSRPRPDCLHRRRARAVPGPPFRDS
jgi:hypothetical protein